MATDTLDFYEPNSPNYKIGVIDKVYLGRDEQFTSRAKLRYVTREERQNEYDGQYPGNDGFCDELVTETAFECSEHGFRTIGGYYSDHRIVMIEVEADVK